MRRFARRALAWGSTGALAAACTTGEPIQDTVDADIDTAWLQASEDAGAPTPDAAVLAHSDAAGTSTQDASDGSSVADVGAPLEAGDDGAAAAGDGQAGNGCPIASCGARSVCASGHCVPARRVFVSASTFTGNLGGHAGADGTCQDTANAAGLGGVWMAWISDFASSPSQRFNRANYEYALLDGTVVAGDWTVLTSGTLAHGIDENEHGQAVGGGTTEVWTATRTNGSLFANGCNGFTSSSSHAPVVEVGVSGNTDSTWTEVYLQFCSRTDHLYCFEQ
jgi:hypothetical protein